MYSKKPGTEPLRDKWTKYFVNDIECEREAIYQTILDNKFYTDSIALAKKYHFELHEKNIKEERIGYALHYKETKSDKSENRYAYFSLNTKEFIAKHNPTSNEYKILVERMSHALDMIYEAQQDYAQYSEKLRTAIRNCMIFFCENTNDMTAPYTEIAYKLSIELFVFLSDILAFGLSEGKVFNHKELPSLVVDLSGIKEKWNVNWADSKKSQFVNEYLSILLQQMESIRELWMRSDLFDESSKNKMADIFAEFKLMIKLQQVKKDTLDKALANVHDRLTLSNNSYNFYYQPQSTKEANESECPKLSNTFR
ncbi:hypothetical protein Lgra_1359 [Legionella gratiana]|uniref:Uncharacterized protein n=1 Tax=Legionella gratiana TaxID=45066 RepID=A0A378JI06_9GAMM|nr:hypothetical protein [Legionella gratiana]KTD11901.1 hypothetical protein Lgra_1359 [Legionella gratiana]STX46507.1 Uncharacterised protein [Legionella gratiana]